MKKCDKLNIVDKNKNYSLNGITEHSMIYYWNICLISFISYVIYEANVGEKKKCCLQRCSSALRHTKFSLTGKLEDVYGKH